MKLWCLQWSRISYTYIAPTDISGFMKDWQKWSHQLKWTKVVWTQIYRPPDCKCSFWYKLSQELLFSIKHPCELDHGDLKLKTGLQGRASIWHWQIMWINCLSYSYKISGLVRDLNPGPRAPEARIIPLDQRATSSGTTQTERLCSWTINSMLAGSC